MLNLLRAMWTWVFWTRPLTGHNTVLVVLGVQKKLPFEKPEFPQSRFYTDTGKLVQPHPCGLARYRLKEGLIFRKVINGINNKAYEAKDPLSGKSIFVSEAVFLSLFESTRPGV